jgi:hypothetical protein
MRRAWCAFGIPTPDAQWKRSTTSCSTRLPDNKVSDISGCAHPPLILHASVIRYDPSTSYRIDGGATMIGFCTQATPGFPNSTRTLRRALAFLCIVLGVAGCILPIMPGLPFFIVGGRLLGPRDRLLRRAIVGGRRALRRLRSARQPLLRRAGVQLTPHWRRFTWLMLGAH